MIAYSPMVWVPHSKMLVVFVDSQRSTHSRKSDSGSVFAHGMGTQMMHQEASRADALKMVEDRAKKLLIDDEVTAILRHINRVSVTILNCIECY